MCHLMLIESYPLYGRTNRNLIMKILITSGIGFIGSAVIRHIINDTSLFITDSNHGVEGICRVGSHCF